MKKQKTDHNNVLFLPAEKLLPSVSVDSVILGFHDGKMKILLNKFETHNEWMLPGGFVYHNENIDDAAYRLLKSRTGLEHIYLQQFHFFGNANRTNIEENKKMLDERNIPHEIDGVKHWFLNRFVTAAYYALVEYSKVKVFPQDGESVDWIDIEDISNLYSDHNEIINKAISTIRTQLGNIPIGRELLPEKFTISELRIIYETILNKKIDRRNFQRNMISNGFIVKLEETCKKWGVKSTALYSFDKERYDEALKNGFSIY